VEAANTHIPGAVKVTGAAPRSMPALCRSRIPLALVRFGVEAVLRTSLERYYKSGADQTAAWYLGDQIPSYLKHGWRPPCAQSEHASPTEQWLAFRSNARIGVRD